MLSLFFLLIVFLLIIMHIILLPFAACTLCDRESLIENELATRTQFQSDYLLALAFVTNSQIQDRRSEFTP